MTAVRRPVTLGRRAPPSALLVLAGLLVTVTAEAQPVPPRCVSLDDAPGYCIPLPAVRASDALRAELPELRVQLRVAEQRLVVALGDAVVQARALDLSSRVVVDLRDRLAVSEARWPFWAHWLVGAGILGVLGSLFALAL